jgi:tetratricopeptide (TPR) repeat protein
LHFKVIKYSHSCIKPYLIIFLSSPDDSRAWASLAKIYLYLNQPNFAISCFERSLECDEKLPFVTFRLGTLYRNSKNTELAVKYFELAISQNFYRDGLVIKHLLYYSFINFLFSIRRVSYLVYTCTWLNIYFLKMNGQLII